MTSPWHIIQVVPKLPPVVDGIGDYAAIIGSRFRELGYDVSSIICTPGAAPPSRELGEYSILPSRGGAPFLNALQSLRRPNGRVHLLVHFAPYAYQKRGVPLWLVNALESIHSMGSASISTIYHELNATSNSILKSAFWLSSVQRQLISKMRRISDLEYTNTREHVERLMTLGSGHVDLATNFSTVGEPLEVPALHERSAQLVIFGRAAMKAITYSSGVDSIQRACQIISATRILDIGSRATNTPDNIGGIPILQQGRLDAVEVSSILLSSKAMYLSYPLELLGKSSVFAAARAHGTIPFVHNEHGTGQDRMFLAGTDYFEIKSNMDTPEISPKQCQIIVDRYAQSSSQTLATQMLRRLNR